MHEELRPEQAPRSLELAIQFGDAYLMLLQALTTDGLTAEERRQQLHAAKNHFPTELQAIIDSTIDSAIGKLEENEQVLRALLKKANYPFSQAAIDDVHTRLLAMHLSKEDGNQPQYYSLLKNHTRTTRRGAGIYQVNVDAETMAVLRQQSRVLDNIDGHHVHVDISGSEYTFVILYDKEANTPHGDALALHEYHHLLYNALRQSSSLRENREVGENAQLFDKFKDEICGYLLTAQNLGKFDWGVVKASQFVGEHGNEYMVARQIYPHIHLIEDTYRAAAKRNIPAAALIYPVITARSFAELDQRVLATQEKINRLPITTPPESTQNQAKKTTHPKWQVWRKFLK